MTMAFAAREPALDRHAKQRGQRHAHQARAPPQQQRPEHESQRVADQVAARVSHRLVQPEQETIDKKEFRQMMREMVETLPDEQKEVLMMRMYYDMSFKEIADVTQVSINTALGRMRYALINLRKMMEERQVEISF